MSGDSVWRLLSDCLGKGIHAVLLSVTENTGSSPGKPGAKLAIAANGRMVGTIGGGTAERRAIMIARGMLWEPSPPARLLRFHHENGKHGDGAKGAASGMICGGGMTVAIVPCRAGDLPSVLKLADIAEHRRTDGRLQLSPAGLRFVQSVGNADRRFVQTGPADWSYEENVGPKTRAYLIGGGHVSLALSQILAMLDFRVTVLEERSGIATLESNVYADEKRQVSYDDIAGEIIPGDHVFVVVLTHAHKLDEKVLRQLLDKRLSYLGMLGSRHKTAEILSRLRPDFPESLLARIHAPAGLPIGSHTPAEIAVSIAAQMIAVSNGLPTGQ